MPYGRHVCFYTRIWKTEMGNIVRWILSFRMDFVGIRIVFALDFIMNSMFINRISYRLISIFIERQIRFKANV